MNHDRSAQISTDREGRALEAASRGWFGALPHDNGVRFRVFAPAAGNLQLHLLTGAAAGTHAPDDIGEGMAEFAIEGAGAGDRYCYTIDDSPPRPDPATRFQPDGVHGASEIIDPDAYRWRQWRWRRAGPRDLVVYELHVGTFTEPGTFAAARERLPELRDLGVTAVELMPVAEFPGARNWGYDGVSLFAPSRNYGRPDDMRAFVDAAHDLDLAVILDVVYNHLGPEGAYLPLFNPHYISSAHATPWGGAVNLDGPRSVLVRRFIVDNALHWIREYRLDGLRLDATHALVDDGDTHIVAELVDAIRDGATWPVMIHAEDHRNLAVLLEPREAGGWGLDAVWADDFHHIVRRQLAGDTYGYFEDYAGTCEELAQTIEQGWFFTGQPSRHMQAHRGSDASQIAMHRFIVCLQNHDQIGNRATGDRLNHAIDAAAWRAASTLLLTLPMTPLLFMGQEWAASTPFQYFTDLEPELGKLVTEGRRLEFRHFPAFADPESRQAIPNPQAESTFVGSKLQWHERDAPEHRAVLELYKALLRLRRSHGALAAELDVRGDAQPLDPGTILVRRSDATERFFVVARLSGRGAVSFEHGAQDALPEVVLTTEDERFVSEPQPPRVDVEGARVSVDFDRPGAVILRSQ